RHPRSSTTRVGRITTTCSPEASPRIRVGPAFGDPTDSSWCACTGTVRCPSYGSTPRSEEHTSELQSRFELVCRLLLEKKNAVKSNRSIARAASSERNGCSGSTIRRKIAISLVSVVAEDMVFVLLKKIPCSHVSSGPLSARTPSGDRRSGSGSAHFSLLTHLFSCSGLPSSSPWASFYQ